MVLVPPLTLSLAMGLAGISLADIISFLIFQAIMGKPSRAHHKDKDN
jgi:hypothetical protein